MLVLSRKSNETIKIGDDIEIRILEVKGDTVRIGIEAPKSVDILRGELVLSISESNTEATALDATLFSQLTKKKKLRYGSTSPGNLGSTPRKILNFSFLLNILQPIRYYYCKRQIRVRPALTPRATIKIRFTRM